ncbi:hypothetical protein AMECASPLE_007582 [Ameca splendens]|uniref:Uncharacterized protein n=1 Tax=Ameca splendens TaxID=208324 RepID=A0ABV0XZK9_9TELE
MKKVHILVYLTGQNISDSTRQKASGWAEQSCNCLCSLPSSLLYNSLSAQIKVRPDSPGTVNRYGCFSCVHEHVHQRPYQTDGGGDENDESQNDKIDLCEVAQPALCC